MWNTLASRNGSSHCSHCFNSKLIFLVFNRGATLNFFRVIFGIGQMRLPQKSFSRFLLMMFLILCLILRTCHQSMLYDLMQKDLRRPEIETIKEAIEKGYTFYFQHFNVARYNQTDFYKR
jgi:hypothetical protein